MTTDLSEVPQTQRRETAAEPRRGALVISNTIVALLRARAGRGPTKAWTLISSHLVVVTLRDCLTTAEKTLVAAGLTAQVSEARHALHNSLREEATSVVEGVTGKRVAAFLADQHHEPDVAVLAFMLEKRDDG